MAKKNYSEKDERDEDLSDLERLRDNAIRAAHDALLSIHSLNGVQGECEKEYVFSGTLTCGEYEDDKFSISVVAANRRAAIRELSKIYGTKFSKSNVNSFLIGSIGGEDLIVEEYGGERAIRFSSMTLRKCKRRII